MSCKKYSPRSLPSIRTSNEQDNNYWYDNFVNNLQKGSQSSSIYDDINAILGNSKSRFSSVEDAVKDLKERTGLDKILSAKQIVATIQEPDIFKTVPELKIFIDNFIDDRPGTSVESVVHDLLKIDSIRNKLPDKNDVGEDVRIYINKCIGNSHNTDINKVDMHIGKVDNSSEHISEDPFAMCEPSLK